MRVARVPPCKVHGRGVLPPLRRGKVEARAVHVRPPAVGCDLDDVTHDVAVLKDQGKGFCPDSESCRHLCRFAKYFATPSRFSVNTSV